MTSAGPPVSHDSSRERSVWGLSATGLLAAWWKGQGVQVVVRGEGTEVDPDAELYLLVDPASLPVFELSSLIEIAVWNPACIIRLAILDEGPEVYHEEIVRNSTGDVVGVKRVYVQLTSKERALGLTGNMELGILWSKTRSREDAWMAARDLGRDVFIDKDVRGHHFQSTDSEDRRRLMEWLVARWKEPSRVLDSVVECQPGVFCRKGFEPPASDTLVSPIWIGETTNLENRRMMPGPNIIYDETASPFISEPKAFRDIRLPRGRKPGRLLPRGTFSGAVKRMLDILVSAAVLILGSPIFILASIAIIIDDGFPIFFGHERQRMGGENFRCWKFRTMRRNAEQLVASMSELNQADGPQVFIENDPRVTRVGRFLRKVQIDEFPQFWNVLKGDMSLVGPRPSPERENQFCPAWRELRLSVRPGITGLWQVSRTRAPGQDFQEWIRFDVDYVRNASLKQDFIILLRTIRTIF